MIKSTFLQKDGTYLTTYINPSNVNYIKVMTDSINSLSGRIEIAMIDKTFILEDTDLSLVKYIVKAVDDVNGAK